MWTIVTSLLAPFAKELIIGVGGLFGLWMAYLGIKRGAINQVKKEQAENALKTETNRKNIDTTVRTQSQSESDSLRDSYKRD